MAKKRFTESQIYRILQENENGTTIPALIKKYGISQATIYNWRAKYGKMNISEIYRVSELEEENDRLKATVPFHLQTFAVPISTVATATHYYRRRQL